MNIEEARLYLEHTSKDDFNLEEWQKENRYQAIQVILQEIERLNNIINELEKFMDEDYEYYKKYGSAEQGHAMGQIRRIKNKLQELKWSDKSE